MAVTDTSIPARMRAIECHGPRDYRLTSAAVRPLCAHELLVKVSRCGICAGDSKCYAGAAAFWGGGDSAPFVEVPVIPG